MKKNQEDVIVAEFQIPLKFENSSEILQILPQSIEREALICCDSLKRESYGQNQNAQPSPGNPEIPIILRSGGGRLTFCIQNQEFLRPSTEDELIRGTIHFCSKLFGPWEPFESFRYFVRSPSQHGIFEYIFDMDQLETTLSGFRKTRLSDNDCFPLELNLTLEHLNGCVEEERILEDSRAKMKNDLLKLRDKSDFRITVGDTDFYVHTKYLGDFIDKIKTLSKYADQCGCDWSNIMTPESLQVLLRFIYYKEVGKIDSVDVLFRLLKFSHMFMVQDLLRICQIRLLKCNEDMYSLADVFDIYLFVRVANEFKDLKKHFCRILSTSTGKWDLMELNVLAQQCRGGVGVDVLVEIIEMKDKQSSVEVKVLPHKEEEEDDDMGFGLFD